MGPRSIRRVPATVEATERSRRELAARRRQTLRATMDVTPTAPLLASSVISTSRASYDVTYQSRRSLRPIRSQHLRTSRHSSDPGRRKRLTSKTFHRSQAARGRTLTSSWRFVVSKCHVGPYEHDRRLTHVGNESCCESEANVAPISGSFQRIQVSVGRGLIHPTIHPPPLCRKRICIYPESVRTVNSLHALSLRQHIRGNELHKDTCGTAAQRGRGRLRLVAQDHKKLATGG